MSEHDEMAEAIQAQVLRAFGLKPWDAGLAPAPLRIRIWRIITRAYRRGKAIDWRSYNTADAEARAATEAYKAALPGRVQEVADQLSDGLPDGMRFEWAPDD
jgi:hypothetical protein